MTQETNMLRITTEFLFNERIKYLAELSPDFHMSLACLDSELIMNGSAPSLCSAVWNQLRIIILAHRNTQL